MSFVIGKFRSSSIFDFEIRYSDTEFCDVTFNLVSVLNDAAMYSQRPGH